jgi:predicted secreted protein
MRSMTNGIPPSDVQGNVFLAPQQASASGRSRPDGGKIMAGFGRLGRVMFLALALMVVILSSAGAQIPPPQPLAGDQSVLHLSETAQHDVPRDVLHATLAAEAIDADAAKVQTNINQHMTAALTRIKQVTGITVETTGYSVYRDNPDKNPARWHGSQSVTLTGKDFAALLALSGTLQQQGLVMQALTPDLSREARQSVEDSLTTEALARLQQRADRIAAAAGVKLGGFRSLSVGNVNAPPAPIRPLAMARADVSSMPAPVAEPGSTPVSITVTAEFNLAAR